MHKRRIELAVHKIKHIEGQTYHMWDTYHIIQTGMQSDSCWQKMLHWSECDTVALGLT